MLKCSQEVKAKFLEIGIFETVTTALDQKSISTSARKAAASLCSALFD
jgi:hypothetical protein